MPSKTNISWTDRSYNPTIGCAKVSQGCKNCYAQTMAKRLKAMGKEGYDQVIDDRGLWNGRAIPMPSRLTAPFKIKTPQRWFVDSMSDLFHEDINDHYIAEVFGVMMAAKHHTFQVLTKRPERMESLLCNRKFRLTATTISRECVNGIFRPTAHPYPLEEYDEWPYQAWPAPNIWLGVSAEDQATADQRIPLLLDTPAAIRFVSAEPLLGPLDLIPYMEGVYGLDWLITGCESGPSHRPMDMNWVRALRDQCAATSTAFFFKQAFVDGKRVEEPLLDGVQHQAMPVNAHTTIHQGEVAGR